MGYIIHYDVAGVIVLVTVMVHFFYKNKINTRQTRIFSVLIQVALIANVLDLITIYTIEHVEVVSLFVNYLLNCAYLIVFNATPVIYYAYILLAVNPKEKWKVWKKFWVFGPILISIVLILLTPITKWIFYFDEQDVYQHGAMMLVLYIVSLYYVGSSLVCDIVYQKKLTGVQRATIYFYTISSLVSIALQMLFPKLMIIHFVIAICILLIYLSLENPEDYSDKELGVYNRRALIEILGAAFNKEKSFDIMALQVDGGKYVRETMGVDSEQQLLKEVAEYLLHASGHLKVFYLSGARFVIVGRIQKEQWELMIDEIHNRFRRPFIVNGVEVTLSVPMCMLSYPDNISRLEDVSNLMAYALSQAKAAGNEVVIYPGEDALQEGRREQQILQIMKQALREKTFEVYYQPIFSVQKQRFASAEALVRLRDKELGFISPEEFIPLAEKNGLILEIGEFVFREVCQFMTKEKIWEKGIEVIDVNLSAVQCMQEKLSDELLEIMDEYHLKYHYINLEITETAAIMSSETLWGNMERLIEKGIEFSMDDYGTGYSNTAHIIKYPFRTIKLDKSMVWSAMEDSKAMCALRHTISMIKDMQMDLIAEGVETKEQARQLTEMGCDFFQGYYYSKPVCAEEFLEKLNQTEKA
jgi:EAL domain-containing protein (putative c-di-GMP-specific phosphodiesterase class I)/GGDEF domain-containing protein